MAFRKLLAGGGLLLTRLWSVVLVGMTIARGGAEPVLSAEQSARIIAAIGAGDPAALVEELPRTEDLNAKMSTGDTPLIAAASLNRKAVAQTLLERGADVNAPGARGWTSLMAAIFYGNWEVVDLLRRHGARADMSGEDGATAQSIALWRGNTDLAHELPAPGRQPASPDLLAAVVAGDHEAISKFLTTGVPPTAADPSGNPAILIAAAAGDTETINQLLTAGAPADSTGPDGITALMVAVQQKREVVAKALVDAGADPLRPTDKGVTAIAIADALGLDQIAKVLRSKAKTSGSDEGGISALAQAAGANDVIKVKRLIESGINPDGGLVRGKRVVPLAAAAFKGSSNAAATLVKLGALTDQYDQDKNTPLMAAIVGKHRDIADFLLQHGADSKRRNNAGQSPVSMARAVGWSRLGTMELYTQEDFNEAVTRGDAATVRELVPGHSVWATLHDEHGWYPLMYAAQAGNPDVTELLLQNGSLVEISDTTVPSPLMIAAANGRQEVIQLLLSHGADPTRQDGAGHSAADIARSKGFAEVASRLQAATKTYASRINAALVALGYLDKPDDTWGPKNRKALEAFYNAFPGISKYPTPEALDKALKRTMRVCNSTALKLWLARVSRVDTSAYAPQMVRGWLSLDSGSCTWITRNNTSDGLPEGELWLYAESGSFWWGGDRTLCLPEGGGKLDDYFAELGPNCRKGTKAAKFYRMVPYSSANPQIIKATGQ